MGMSKLPVATKAKCPVARGMGNGKRNGKNGSAATAEDQ
jgi:hypothetical protein